MKRLTLVGIALILLVLGFYHRPLNSLGSLALFSVQVPPEPPKPIYSQRNSPLEAGLKKTREEIVANSYTITVSGVAATAGTSILIADKEIQLPADVYIEAQLIDVLCVSGLPCPETPLTVLRYIGSTDNISVNPNTGIIYEHPIGTPDEQQRIRQRFQWLYDALPWQNFRRLFRRWTW